ncbi:uncharacterized protein E0L32_006772 [Thyridium curvatum]|uniref:Uncharacterized protein n=1 Tax=Thyridium curvatum TaxID=1093900 RepID=A0A507ASB7_9PEZI|nr:uncharacterized protein E0L32_006772 [Thyridium curvatum]TPX12892.1 hypothetical protein E0L32_006772 [Thyridium curvatum]
MSQPNPTQNVTPDQERSRRKKANPGRIGEGLNEFGFRRELYVIALRQLAKKQALRPTGYGDMDLGCLRHPQVKLRARFAFVPAELEIKAGDVDAVAEQ